MNISSRLDHNKDLMIRELSVYNVNFCFWGEGGVA